MLEEKIENIEGVSKLSDQELADIKSRLASQNDTEIDLRAYDRSQRRLDDITVTDKISAVCKRLLGLSPERQLNRLINRLTQEHATYATQVHKLEEQLDGQVEKLHDLGVEYTRHQAHATVVMEQYERLQERVDRLEVEVEQAGGELSAKALDARDRLVSGQSELRSLRHEADRAIRSYAGAKRQYTSLSDQHQQLAGHVSELRRQEAHIGSVIDSARQSQILQVDGQKTSLATQYKTLGMLAQDVQKMFDTEFTAPAGVVLDTTYGAPQDKDQKDPLMQRWTRLRK